MPGGAGELVDNVAVPIEAEPFHAVDDGVDGGLGGALAVGVLDAQHHLAAMAPGVEPVEKRRARAANMQKAGGRGRKTGDDVGHVGARFLKRLRTRSSSTAAGVEEIRAPAAWSVKRRNATPAQL